MKKIKYLLLLCVVAIITTGCVKFNVNMDIKKDKSMDFSIIYAFDKSLMGESNSLKEEQFDEAKKQGFKVEKYSEGNMEGFKLTRKIKNIDDVSSESDVEYDLSKLMEEGEEKSYIFKVVKGTEKNTYTANIKFDSSSSGLSGSMTTDDETTPDEDEAVLTTGKEAETAVTEDEPVVTIGEDPEVTTSEDDQTDLTGTGSDYDISGMMSNLDLSFNVTLPYSALSSNATTKENDNKNLSWKLTTSGSQNIEFSFELNNNESDSNMLLYIGVAAGVIALVIVFILVFGKKKAPTNTVANKEVDNNTPAKE